MQRLYRRAVSPAILHNPRAVKRGLRQQFGARDDGDAAVALGVVWVREMAGDAPPLQAGALWNRRRDLLSYPVSYDVPPDQDALELAAHIWAARWPGQQGRNWG